MKSYAVCATGILEAWQQSNLPRLKHELENASSFDLQSAATDEERERLELLEGIAAEMKVMMARGSMEQTSPYSMLLRHLASGG